MNNVHLVFLGLIALAASGAPPPASSPAASRPRLIVLADMGNEPDEEQQNLHLLVCANELQLEGLIAVTGKYLRPEAENPYKRTLHPELFHRLIDGYASVYPNLQLHAAGWHSPDDLHRIVVCGQTGYGMADVGEGRSGPGAELIIAAVTHPDPRPVHIVVNAGSNTLAQALRDYRARHTAAEQQAFVAKLRIFENGAQDNAGAWICHEFPEIFWVRSNYQTYCYGGPSDDNLGPYTWKPFAYGPAGQDDWARVHIRANHGELGGLFPSRSFGKDNRLHFLEGGGTIPWMGLVCPGLTESAEPSWGGWSGRFTAVKVPNVWSRHSDIKAEEQSYVPFSAYAETADRWADAGGTNADPNPYAPVWRWRAAMYNDFAARMDWCVQPFAKANHHPRASVNGNSTKAIVRLTAKPGDVMTFDAAGSTDPDGDPLRYLWWIYPEAGRHPFERELPIREPRSDHVSFAVPADAIGKELHLILEVWDQSPTLPLADYRRIVVSVGP